MTKCRPLEPDTGNTGVGKGNETVSFRDAVFVFMKLIVNGEKLEVLNVETLQDLLKELQIESQRVAVEINVTIVKKSDYSTFKLNEGDRVEIVNFIGGG
jgi:sulfur carrier protein